MSEAAIILTVAELALKLAEMWQQHQQAAAAYAAAVDAQASADAKARMDAAYQQCKQIHEMIQHRLEEQQ